MMSFMLDLFSAIPLRQAADNPAAGCLVHPVGCDGKVTGDYIILCHGAEDGSILGFFLDMARRYDALIVACHPGRIAKRYPDLRLCGDWDGETNVVSDIAGCTTYVTVSPV